MTRPLHVETKVQRGERPSREQRERGYEPRDASPGKVMLGVACFLGLMLAGLAFAGATLGWLEHDDDQPRDTGRTMAISPPSPHPLAKPLSARRRYEADMDKRIDPAALARARRDLVQCGWDGAQAAPTVEATGRAHREAVR